MLGFGLIKKLFSLVFLLIVLSIVGFIYMDSLAQKGIEAGGKYALGTDVKVANVKIKVVTGNGVAIDGLEIANPQGFSSAPFLRTRSAAVEMPFKNLMADKVEVSSVVIDGIDVSIEKQDGKTNYGVITDNLGKFKKPGTSPDTGSSKKFVIKELVIKKIRVSTSVAVLGVTTPSVPFDIDEIKMQDLGASGGGVSLAEIFGAVVEGVLRQVSGSGSKFLPADLANDLAGKVNGMMQLQNQGAKLIETGAPIIDGIKDLFGGKK